MVSCPTCGADLKFDPKSQMLICPNCRNKYNPEDETNLKVDDAKEQENITVDSNGLKVISYKCSHCGAELFTTEETITTFCSFCRSGTILNRKVIKKRVPDYVIPFAITKEECEEIYINKIKESFFAPNCMIDSQELEKIRPIYMPYWLYSFKYNGPNITKGTVSHRSGNYVIYNDYEISTNLDVKFMGITHDASADFSDRMSETIEPFDIKKIKNFSPAYLSGYYADNEDVHSKVYVEDFNEMVNDIVSEDIGKIPVYATHNAIPKVELNEKSVKLALFPVYFLATKSRWGNKLHYAVINGQTGKIAADIPIDFKKFFGFSLIMAFIIFFFLNMFLTLTMPNLIVCSIIFNLISYYIINKQNNKLKEKDDEISDRGIEYKKSKTIHNSNKKRKKSSLTFIKTFTKFIINIVVVLALFIIASMYNIELINTIILYIRDNFCYIFITPIIILMIVKIIKNPKHGKNIALPLIGLIISIIILNIEPALDEYYYISAFVSITMSIVCICNIIWKHNVITSKKLSQLGKRGGDENA